MRAETLQQTERVPGTGGQLWTRRDRVHCGTPGVRAFTPVVGENPRPALLAGPDLNTAWQMQRVRSDPQSLRSVSAARAAERAGALLRGPCPRGGRARAEAEGTETPRERTRVSGRDSERGRGHRALRSGHREACRDRISAPGGRLFLGVRAAPGADTGCTQGQAHTVHRPWGTNGKARQRPQSCTQEARRASPPPRAACAGPSIGPHSGRPVTWFTPSCRRTGRNPRGQLEAVSVIHTHDEHRASLTLPLLSTSPRCCLPGAAHGAQSSRAARGWGQQEDAGRARGLGSAGPGSASPLQVVVLRRTLDLCSEDSVSLCAHTRTPWRLQCRLYRCKRAPRRRVESLKYT